MVPVVVVVVVVGVSSSRLGGSPWRSIGVGDGRPPWWRSPTGDGAAESGEEDTGITAGALDEDVIPEFSSCTCTWPPPCSIVPSQRRWRSST